MKIAEGGGNYTVGKPAKKKKTHTEKIRKISKRYGKKYGFEKATFARKDLAKFRLLWPREVCFGAPRGPKTGHLASSGNKTDENFGVWKPPSEDMLSKNVWFPKKNHTSPKYIVSRKKIYGFPPKCTVSLKK